ncbi:methionine adenosyltransferase [Mesomycoplasma ovipneumoniae]|uniref:Methionine adenosyltransferase n=1 Tax=Mesomycoplasma ovipneumoniae TaxID=29562 RepID=A0AAP5Y556_9BACT|nr:methionine adenosyltransferase [Mesomycoplasma ovipneumoniae]MDW2911671.1 methionine adenosyltransferase [Mesomycoplasma ovipneumoniae]MDW2913737.1 methionine adenosyltransferase [Mesomycoplasma ovipneumoniae]MDW2915908.1 methionine adenosyltransferase [Mesomycoplasma ovipneumoniae]MDW2916650.1 methionine adenosyltransferase [Mesomycoplasma ovipneumoniae]MDW2918690.1 methionine adenosyltransferase [Mesomycoplasma ovipneumoniae]
MKISKISVAESVGKGHPDKICDQIADSILDKLLAQDENSRVAIEVMASNRLIIIGGEISTNGYVDFIKTAWEILFEIGYTENDFTIISNVNNQSKEISSLVNRSQNSLGAGDQSIVYGFATNETKNFMPLGQSLAHTLVQKAEFYRKNGQFLQALADMKSQVEVVYDQNSRPKITKMLMSIQHLKNYDQSRFRDFVLNKIMIPTAKEHGLNSDFKIFINQAGEFTIGGPIGDSGLTGRKIIMDSYGDAAHHGGGAFSGKDYTKVDRSGAYIARYIAKNLVAANLADEIEIQLSYQIGSEFPDLVNITYVKNPKFSTDQISQIIRDVFDLRLANLVSQLGLSKPIYQNLAVYGHFGRDDLDLSFEKTDYVEKIHQYLSKQDWKN